MIYIGTYLQVISLIIFSIFSTKIKKRGIFSFIGRELSGKIYIYHIAIGKFVILILKKYKIFQINMPLIILIFVILFSCLTKIIY